MSISEILLTISIMGVIVALIRATIEIRSKITELYDTNSNLERQIIAYQRVLAGTREHLEVIRKENDMLKAQIIKLDFGNNINQNTNNDTIN